MATTMTAPPPGNVVVGRPVGQIGQGVENPHGNIAPGSPINTGNQQSAVTPMQPLDGHTAAPQQGTGGRSPGRMRTGRVSGHHQQQDVVIMQRADGGPPVMMVVMQPAPGMNNQQHQGPNQYYPGYNPNPMYANSNYAYTTGNPSNTGFIQSYGDMASAYPPTLLAVFTCLCCFFPGGICACISLLKCQEGHAAIARNDFESARRAKEEAMRWIYGAWAATLFFMVFYSVR
ncbi:unnamed protein product [Amoebophrya sp. A120]|nr:unnamed protein product [Amoebophrya sp. A120]|eukprot:GSA120T00016547001.1